MLSLKKTRRGYFQSLPAKAREIAVSQFTTHRSRPGPGDPYLYEWVEEEPPFGYRGPMPYVSIVRRKRFRSYAKRNF